MIMNKTSLRQWSVILTSIFALTVNTLAVVLPLNGRSTAAISDSFKVLFVPAGYVFSIWGLIYVGLIGFTIYQALPSQHDNLLLQKVGWLVALSSLLNGGWIFFWHYGVYAMTLVVMLLLLATLIAIYLRLDIGRAAFSAADKWLVSIPFSIYLGWITVATIANVTDVLSWAGFTGGGIDPQAWVVILLAAGVAIATIAAITRRDVAYLLVLVWAFAGIGVHWPALPTVMVASYTAAVLVALLAVYSLTMRLRPQKA
jgi:benzodiazapine receptor